MGQNARFDGKDWRDPDTGTKVRVPEWARAEKEKYEKARREMEAVSPRRVGEGVNKHIAELDLELLRKLLPEKDFEGDAETDIRELYEIFESGQVFGGGDGSEAFRKLWLIKKYEDVLNIWMLTRHLEIDTMKSGVQREVLKSLIVEDPETGKRGLDLLSANQKVAAVSKLAKIDSEAQTASKFTVNLTVGDTTDVSALKSEILGAFLRNPEMANEVIAGEAEEVEEVEKA